MPLRRKELGYLARISSWCSRKAWEGISRTNQDNIGTGRQNRQTERAVWLRKERNREIKDKCPSCGEPEPSTHSARCEGPDRTALFMDSVSKVQHWMQKNATEPGLRRMLVSYLKERGTVQMSNLLPHSVQGMSHQIMNRYVKISKTHDRLGWDCLMEGRVPSILVQHQHEHIKSTQNQMTTKRWVEGMIQQLTGLVHRQ